MPFYLWEGVDWFGRIHYGNDMARSREDLEQHLFKKELGLVRSRKKIPRKRLQPISPALKFELYKQLSVLIQAGIYIDEALRLVQHQLKHEALREIVSDVLTDIQQGQTLAHGFGHYPMYFNTLTQQVLASGQESGTLVQALEHLAEYEETLASFYKKIRSALLLPAITLGFFCLITIIILIIIVPRFAQLFNSMHKEVPWLTQMILNSSDLIQQYGLFVGIGIGIIAVVSLRMIKFNETIKSHADAILLKIPFVGGLVANTILTSYFKSLALLVHGGVHVVSALRLAQESIGNKPLYLITYDIMHHVEEGLSLSEAFGKYPNYFSSEIGALISVGQESGTMEFMFSRISNLYKERVQRRLTIMATVVQPALMLVLGGLITFLIVAVYDQFLPYLQLSDKRRRMMKKYIGLCCVLLIFMSAEARVAQASLSNALAQFDGNLTAFKSKVEALPKQQPFTDRVEAQRKLREKKEAERREKEQERKQKEFERKQKEEERRKEILRKRQEQKEAERKRKEETRQPKAPKRPRETRPLPTPPSKKEPKPADQGPATDAPLSPPPPPPSMSPEEAYKKARKEGATKIHTTPDLMGKPSMKEIAAKKKAARDQAEKERAEALLRELSKRRGSIDPEDDEEDEEDDSDWF